MNPFALFSMATGAFSLFKLLANAGKIIRFIKAFGAIGKDLVEKRCLPSCGESREFLHLLGELFESGVIDIPGVDENAIAKAIGDVEKEIVCKAS